MWDIIEDVLKNVDNQTVFIYIDFPCMDKNSMDVNGNWKYLLQSIFFHVSQKNESHTGLEKHALE